MLSYGSFTYAILKELLNIFRIKRAFALGVNTFGFSFGDTFRLTFTYHGAIKLSKGHKQLHLKHGKCTKEKRLAAKKRAETGRKLRAEIKQIEVSLIEQGILTSNWRKYWKL